MTLTPPQRPLLGREQTVRFLVRKVHCSRFAWETWRQFPRTFRPFDKAFASWKTCRSFSRHGGAAIMVERGYLLRPLTKVHRRALSGTRHAAERLVRSACPYVG